MTFSSFGRRQQYKISTASPIPAPPTPADTGEGKSAEEPTTPTGGERAPAYPVQTELFSHIEWIGEIPPRKWMNFYTKVVSKFAASKGGPVVTFDPKKVLGSAVGQPHLRLFPSIIPGSSMQRPAFVSFCEYQLRKDSSGEIRKTTGRVISRAVLLEAQRQHLMDPLSLLRLWFGSPSQNRRHIGPRMLDRGVEA
jgi:hypothetical protein